MADIECQCRDDIASERPVGKDYFFTDEDRRVKILLHKPILQDDRGGVQPGDKGRCHEEISFSPLLRPDEAER